MGLPENDITCTPPQPSRPLQAPAAPPWAQQPVAERAAMVWIPWTALVLGGVAGVMAGRLLYVRNQFRARFHVQRTRLLSAARIAPSQLPFLRPTGSLPAPVRRYVEAAGAVGRAPLRSLEVRWRGRHQRGNGGRWLPIETAAVLAAEPPGRVRLAECRVGPFPALWAAASWRERWATQETNLFGIRALGSIGGVDTRAKQSLQFWCELLLAPEVTRDRRLRWESVDQSIARVHVADDDWGELTADVRFGADAMPSEVSFMAATRPDGVQSLPAWRAELGDWRKLGERLFPARWRTTTMLPGGVVRVEELEVIELRCSS